MFDPADHTCGIADISRHIHLNRKRPETLHAQQRLLRKWLAGREQLFARTRQPAEDREAWQLARISALVDHVYSTHPYYHRVYKAAGFVRGDIVSWADYHCLPTLTKRDIVENYDLFIGNLDQYAPENLTARTSGSSGSALTVHFDPAMVDHDMLHCMRFDEQMLGRARADSDWYYKIFVAAPYFSSLDGRYPTFTVSNTCSPEAVLQHLKILRPSILAGFPSYLLKLAALLDDPRELKIEAIVTVSESSTRAERQRLSELFAAPVFDEYASVELCLIATECRHGRMHIVEDNVRVDVLDPDERGLGEIVATNLNNTFMPFIRYRQGDSIGIQDGVAECGCGNRFRCLHSFNGRSDQTLFSRVTGPIRSDLVMALYDRLLLTSAAGVKEFQIVQEAQGQIVLFIVPTSAPPGADPDTLAGFATGLRQLFEDPELGVEIRIVDAMPPNRSHKRRLIENRMPS